MLVATFFFALMNVLVKLVPGIPSVEIVFFRSVISLVISGAILTARRINVWGTNRRLLFLRGGVGAVSLILYFYTLQKIPLASAVTIQFMAPVFTAILGVFMAKEKVSPIQWLFFAISFAGVVVIQGYDERLTMTYLLIGIVAAFFAGMAYNIIRIINVREHPLVIVFYFPLVTLPVTGGLSAFNWVMPQGWEWLLLLALGVVVQVAQTLMTMAYQREELSKIASLKYIGIIYALGFGWLLFGEEFNFMTYTGMLLVITGVGLNVYYKKMQKTTTTG